MARVCLLPRTAKQEETGRFLTWLLRKRLQREMQRASPIPSHAYVVGSQYFLGWLRQLVESLPEYRRIFNGFIFHMVSFLF